MKLNNKVLTRVVAIGLVLGLTTAWADDHAIASSGLVGTWSLEVSAMRGIQYLTLEVIEEAGGFGGVVTGRRGRSSLTRYRLKAVLSAFGKR